MLRIDEGRLRSEKLNWWARQHHQNPIVSSIMSLREWKHRRIQKFTKTIATFSAFHPSKLQPSIQDEEILMLISKRS
jgi:hypothetical protein